VVVKNYLKIFLNGFAGCFIYEVAVCCKKPQHRVGCTADDSLKE